MPFTALKPLEGGDYIHHPCGCAPPNAVYGIETIPRQQDLLHKLLVVRRLMPFTALKLTICLFYKAWLTSCAPPNAVYGIETRSTTFQQQDGNRVVRRLMPFTALKQAEVAEANLRKLTVVRRLMPFTALKLLTDNHIIMCNLGSCAPPNAVYGIET